MVGAYREATSGVLDSVTKVEPLRMSPPQIAGCATLVSWQ